MKTRIITAIVGILVLIGVMFTFNTMVFNLVIAAHYPDRHPRDLQRPRL